MLNSVSRELPQAGSAAIMVRANAEQERWSARNADLAGDGDPQTRLLPG